MSNGSGKSECKIFNIQFSIINIQFECRINGNVLCDKFEVKSYFMNYNLEDRLVDYTCRMIDVVEALPNTRSGNYIAGQLIRSCHSPTFNYGEAQAAESTRDFAHKISIVLKELKECRTALKIIMKKEMIKPRRKLNAIMQETEELIPIFGKSVATVKKSDKAA
jgi:four helix bundle protein